MVTQQAEQTCPRHTSGRDVLLPAWPRSSFGSTSLQESATCANRKPGLASTCVVQDSRDKCPGTQVRRRHPLQARAQGKRNTCSCQIPLVLKPQRNHTHTPPRCSKSRHTKQNPDEEISIQMCCWRLHEKIQAHIEKERETCKAMSVTLQCNLGVRQCQCSSTWRTTVHPQDSDNADRAPQNGK